MLAASLMVRFVCRMRGSAAMISARCSSGCSASRSLPIAEALRRLSLALSPATEPIHAAGWLEGFLRGSGELLIHDDRLFALIDRWLGELRPESFDALLPILRRTFASFSAAERRLLGRRAARGAVAVARDIAVDRDRARAALPVVARMLGLTEET